MQVVDAVQVHIFSMPGKTCLPHSKVEICGVDSRNADSIFLLHCVENRAQPVDVPHSHIRGVEGSLNICPIQWLVETDVLPKFSFKLLTVLQLRWAEPEGGA